MLCLNWAGVLTASLKASRGPVFSLPVALDLLSCLHLLCCVNGAASKRTAQQGLGTDEDMCPSLILLNDAIQVVML